MTAPRPEPADHLVVPSLELIADSVATISGFGIAAIREVRPDGVLRLLALAGSSAHLVVDQLEEGTPVAHLQRVLDLSDDWGGFRFLPGERVGEEIATTLIGTGTPPADDPGAWQRRDVLVAPLTTADGTLIGTLDLDLPLDRRRPGPEKLAALNRYAVQAGRAVATHFERARLAREIEQAEATRRVIRDTSFAVSEEAALRSCAPAVLDCFGAILAAFWRVEAPDTDILFRPDGTEQSGYFSYPPTFAETLRTFAEHHEVGIIGPGQMHNSENDPHLDLVLSLLAQERGSSALLAPISVLGTLYGGLVIMRPAGTPAWTDSEIATVLTICGDLGRALQNARDLQREQAVVRELRLLDRYRSDLLRTVSHELKTPLTSILGNIELLRHEDDPDVVSRAISTVERGAARLARTIADLADYSAVTGSAAMGDAAGASGSPDPPAHRLVDLTAVVLDACELLGHDAESRGTTLQLALPTTAVTVRGDAALLDRVVVNLVSNALKYTPTGGRVQVALTQVPGDGVADGPMVELAVSDTGIGISPEDQKRLFSTFFRSADPRTATQPGTGLGLAIAHRIVTDHGGTIGVESRLDGGSVFRVRLPDAARADGDVTAGETEETRP